MSTNTITRPTTVSQRAEFTGLTAEQRVTVRNAAIASGLTGKDAWAVGFASLKPVKKAKSSKKAASEHKGGMPVGHTFQRAVGHRLVTLRKTSGECSCGQRYIGTDPGDVRGAHASHKAQDIATAA